VEKEETGSVLDLYLLTKDSHYITTVQLINHTVLIHSIQNHTVLIAAPYNIHCGFVIFYSLYNLAVIWIIYKTCLHDFIAFCLLYVI